jgi:ribosome-associated toxin RatA of RatAB toxin-antitoxin module
MERVHKQIFIEAPPARIFDYLGDATHLPEIWQSVVEVSNAQAKPTGALDFDWVYKMAGMRFHGRSETIDVKRERLRVVKNEGGIPATSRWTFEPRGNGTDFSLEVEYEMPKSLLARLAMPFLLRVNEREADALVHNLKERMEMA